MTVQEQDSEVVVMGDGDGGDGQAPPAEEPQAQSPRARRRRDWLPRDRTRLLTLWVSAMVALLALWLVVYGLALSTLQQHGDQARLYDTLREELAGGQTPPPLGGVITPGDPVALIQAPQIGLNQVVVEGTSAKQLTTGPGHRRDTALPGQQGVSVIFGRSVTFGAPFARITRLAPGQTITAVTGQGTFHYRVDGVRRAGDPLPPPVASGAGRLVLVSTAGSGWRNGWAPSQVVYVDATLQGAPQPAPAGRPVAVGADEAASASGTADLTALVLWLQALVLVIGGTTWATVRWGRKQAWLVGAPLVLAALWGATSAVAVLAPNLL